MDGIDCYKLPQVCINGEGLKADTVTYGYKFRAPEGDLLTYPELPAERTDEDMELPRT